jgi:polyisoprenoid-binding protein YceI
LQRKKMKTMETSNKPNWVIDPAHSEIHFKVKHLVISTVTGSFEKFEGSATTNGEEWTDAAIRFTADVNSINTNAPDRDNHLKSPDFFDAANYPKLTFTSSSFRNTGGDSYQLAGDLTIRGITLPVTLAAEFGGKTVDPWGFTRVGFELSGKVNRKEFGLHWNALTEAGSMVVADEVRLQINVELIKQA